MRNIVTIALVLILVPQMVFAAWWKPTTWRIFNKSNETQALQERIKHLEQELEKSTSTPKIEPLPSTPVTKPSLKEKSSINNSVPTPIPQDSVSEISFSYSDLIKKYTELENAVLTQRRSLTRGTGALPVERQFWDYLGDLLSSIRADVGYISQVKDWAQQPVGLAGIYSAKYAKLNSEYLTAKKSYDTNFAEQYKEFQTQQKNLKQAEIETKRNQIAELCTLAKSLYKEATDKKFARVERYNKEVTEAQTGSISKGAQAGILSNIYQNYSIDIAPIELDIQKAVRDTQIYCF